MKVILGGSRRLSFLPDEVIDSLRAWMHEDAEFLLGEAKGTDAKFQEYLASSKYNSVKVYFSGDYARHNYGNWDSVKVESGLKSKSHAMHSAKDRIMTSFADTGLMMWDTLSVGTISNVIHLLSQGKSCLFYVAGDHSNLFHFNEIENLDGWTDKYPEVFAEATKRLQSYLKRISRIDSQSDHTLF